MADGEQQQKPPSVVPPGAYLQTVLPMAFGIVIGRLASDGVRESVGWWASVGIGMLAAVVAVLTVYFIIQAARRGK